MFVPNSRCLAGAMRRAGTCSSRSLLHHACLFTDCLFTARVLSTGSGPAAHIGLPPAGHAALKHAHNQDFREATCRRCGPSRPHGRHPHSPGGPTQVDINLLYVFMHACPLLAVYSCHVLYWGWATLGTTQNHHFLFEHNGRPNQSHAHIFFVPDLQLRCTFLG